MPATPTHWDIEVEAAFTMLASGDEATFRKHMIALGFDDEEIEKFVALESQVPRKP